jgi:hypothetical protein
VLDNQAGTDRKLSSFETEIKGTIGELTRKNEDLSRELGEVKQYVEDELEDLKVKAADLEDSSKRLNIIFKGIREEKGENVRAVIDNFCVNQLGIQKVNVERAHRMSVFQ